MSKKRECLYIILAFIAVLAAHYALKQAADYVSFKAYKPYRLIKVYDNYEIDK